MLKSCWRLQLSLLRQESAMQMTSTLWRINLSHIYQALQAEWSNADDSSSLPSSFIHILKNSAAG